MILNPMRQFLFSITMGVIFMISPMISVVIIYRKFQANSQYDVETAYETNDNYDWDYS